MQVLDSKTGCVISTTDAISDCPECGALRESSECAFCGWTEPTAEHQPAPIVAAAKIEPRRPDPNVHIDAGNELICSNCGGNTEEIDGVLQCPVCGPTPGTEPPAKLRVAVNKSLPNIDDKLPADPRCPKCLEEAEAAARLRSEIPVEVGERAIVVDYSRGGAIMLVCPVCNAEEELAPGRNGGVITNDTVAATSKEKSVYDSLKDQIPDVLSSGSVNALNPAGAQPPLEVKRRKRG